MRKYWIGILTAVLLIAAVCFCMKPRINCISDEESAAQLGFSVENMTENGFVITKQNNKVYVLSSNDECIARAVAYLKKNLMSKSGKVLLEEGEKYIDNGKDIKNGIFIGDKSISEYCISTYDPSALKACKELQYYIQQTSNEMLKVSPVIAKDKSIIKLNVDKDLGKGYKQIDIIDGQVFITAGDPDTLLDNVYLFVDTYLGWMNAGTKEACISSVTSEINLPVNVAPYIPWIEEREAIVVLWNINNPRGVYLNEDTSVKNNVLYFSEEQLYEYVKMLKYCGFTGVQVTDMCSAWAGVDSYEVVHEKIRILADAAHSLDMKFTLWVWGAEFEGYSWTDDTVSFDFDEYSYQHLNPEVIATCEKYYSIYAELADCCDRVIAHYYDPGNLMAAESVGYFAKMLKDKFHAVNPDIDFGVSCWVDAFDKNILVEYVGTDVTLYESGHHDNQSDYNSFRSLVSELGCRLGTWAWNTCEMEIDQMAQMNFNMDNIRAVYHIARNYDGIMKPAYWSEMDSYHVLNVFSLYCAGQMLINPDIESELLYEQISVAAVGEEYAQDFAQILSIIQDARSGHDWSQYWWGDENYILKSEEYQAQNILDRCNQYIPVLQEMIDQGIESNTLPLPIALNDVLRLMMPHLHQIHDFAEFRIAFDTLQKDYEKGADQEKIQQRLKEISDPIKPYNSVIGVWGQIEAKAQFEMIQEFCNENGLEMPRNSVFDELRKKYIYSQFATFQKANQKQPYMNYSPYYQWGAAYGVEETERLVEEMVQDGLLIRNEDGGVYLADWENYIYHFD